MGDIENEDLSLVGESSYRGKKWFRSRKAMNAAVIIGSIALIMIILLILLLTVFSDSNSKIPDPPSDPLERAKHIQKYYPLIDGHNDLPMRLRELVRDKISSFDLRERQTKVETDIPRLREGQVGGQFWSVFVPCSTKWKDAVRTTIEQIDIVKRICGLYPDAFQLALSASDIESAFDSGKIASLIGIEGGHSIDSSMGALRQFFDMGVRYMTLTHNCNTPWAQSASDAELNPEGLSSFGKEVVKEMNRLGMLVDISHVAHSTMATVLDVTRAPVIFSHSSAYALCDHPRNVPDDILRRMPENGGVVMVNFYKAFVNCTSSDVTLEQVADHIDYIRQVSGIDHVGIGSDFDGVGGQLPTGLEDVSRYIYLTAELYKRGYSDDDVRKIIGGNVLRVFREVESKAMDIKTSEGPNESMISFDFSNNTCRSTF